MLDRFIGKMCNFTYNCSEEGLMRTLWFMVYHKLDCIRTDRWKRRNVR